MSESKTVDPAKRKYLRPEEVADYYRISVKTLKRRQGKDLPRGLKVGGQWRWWGPAILEFDRQLREKAEQR